MTVFNRQAKTLRVSQMQKNAFDSPSFYFQLRKNCRKSVTLLNQIAIGIVSEGNSILCSSSTSCIVSECIAVIRFQLAAILPRCTLSTICGNAACLNIKIPNEILGLIGGFFMPLRLFYNYYRLSVLSLLRSVYQFLFSIHQRAK